VNIEAIADRLDRARIEHAKNALANPGTGTTFEYGKAVGIYTGFLLARSIVEQMASEEKHLQFQ